MKCDNCQQRPATVHFTQIVNQEKSVQHLCEVCAAEKEEYSPMSQAGYTIQDLFSGIFGQAQNAFFPQASRTSSELKEPICPSCQLSFSEFVKTGKFGCSTCYSTFGPRLDPILRRIQAGNVEHTGKVPKRAGKELNRIRDLQKLKTQMQRLIDQEEFEKAAVLRDEIRSLQEKLQKGEE
ncbi:hypothetical protein G4V62_17885 [Bacillaceae bacterium SIJ1]|uniref:UvrB/UvrC motif-containing protein n=1 Tax=Litoribacterium kuwaitense TaxID=1398745 RepID=UPI0013EA816E|nr:UvrB/UvrC motif-containing protein [Litoribacterium kuwaitense]NGP46724.1 hypothetical protein [Litoribacterium kuwaitense]